MSSNQTCVFFCIGRISLQAINEIRCLQYYHIYRDMPITKYAKIYIDKNWGYCSHFVDNSYHVAVLHCTFSVVLFYITLFYSAYVLVKVETGNCHAWLPPPPTFQVPNATMTSRIQHRAIISRHWKNLYYSFHNANSAIRLCLHVSSIPTNLVQWKLTKHDILITIYLFNGLF